MTNATKNHSDDLHNFFEAHRLTPFTGTSFISMTVCRIPRYTSIILCFSLLTSRILF